MLIMSYLDFHIRRFLRLNLSADVANTIISYCYYNITEAILYADTAGICGFLLRNEHTDDAISVALSKGFVNLADKLRCRGYPINCNYCFTTNYSKCVRWLYEHHDTFDNNIRQIFSETIKRNDIETLKWLYTINVEHESVWIDEINQLCHIIYAVAYYGDVDMLLWVSDKYKQPIDDYVLDFAIQHNNKKIIRHILSLNNISIEAKCSAAISCHDLSMLASLCSTTDLQLSHNSMVLAVKSHDVTIIDWLITQGHTITYTHLKWATDDYDLFVYLYGKCVLPVIVDYHTYKHIISNNNIDILEYLVSMGHDIFNEVSIQTLLTSASINMIKYVKSIRSDYFTSSVFTWAVSCGKTMLAKQLIDIGVPVVLNEAVDECIHSKNLRGLQLLLLMGADKRYVMHMSTKHCNIPFMNYMYDSGYPMDDVLLHIININKNKWNCFSLPIPKTIDELINTLIKHENK